MPASYWPPSASLPDSCLNLNLASDMDWCRQCGAVSPHQAWLRQTLAGIQSKARAQSRTSSHRRKTFSTQKSRQTCPCLARRALTASRAGSCSSLPSSPLAPPAQHDPHASATPVAAASSSGQHFLSSKPLPPATAPPPYKRFLLLLPLCPPLSPSFACSCPTSSHCSTIHCSLSTGAALCCHGLQKLLHFPAIAHALAQRPESCSQSASNQPFFADPLQSS